MNRSIRSDSDRAALRRRVRQFYERFNADAPADCFSFIDPQLAARGRVDVATYTEQLQTFKRVYGRVSLWLVRVNLHLDTSPPQRDRRLFAYVYGIWQDAAHEFHMFRERWVKDGERWFTRVVGLVPNRRVAEPARD